MLVAAPHNEHFTHFIIATAALHGSRTCVSILTTNTRSASLVNIHLHSCDIPISLHSKVSGSGDVTGGTIVAGLCSCLHEMMTLCALLVALELSWCSCTKPQTKAASRNHKHPNLHWVGTLAAMEAEKTGYLTSYLRILPVSHHTSYSRVVVVGS